LKKEAQVRKKRLLYPVIWGFILFLVVPGILTFFISVAEQRLIVIPETSEAKVVSNLTGATDIGNLSYLPLNLEGSVQKNFSKIAMALSVWESEHPDWKVVDLEIDSVNELYISDRINGLIIYHQER
jgi:hypothetical protein